MCALVISLVFLGAGALFAKHLALRREYLSPLECGFNSGKETRAPLSLRFFVYAVIFVIFDVELVLVLPIIIVSALSIESVWGFVFITVLLSAGVY